MSPDMRTAWLLPLPDLGTSTIVAQEPVPDTFCRIRLDISVLVCPS
jgi:hypothetical protein